MTLNSVLPIADAIRHAARLLDMSVVPRRCTDGDIEFTFSHQPVGLPLYNFSRRASDLNYDGQITPIVEHLKAHLQQARGLRSAL